VEGNRQITGKGWRKSIKPRERKNSEETVRVLSWTTLFTLVSILSCQPVVSLLG
jgi:hypothetical protein